MITIDFRRGPPSAQTLASAVLSGSTGYALALTSAGPIVVEIHELLAAGRFPTRYEVRPVLTHVTPLGRFPEAAAVDMILAQAPPGARALVVRDALREQERCRELRRKGSEAGEDASTYLAELWAGVSP